MAKQLEIVDDILAPSDTLKIRTEGKHPFKAVPAVVPILKKVLKITTKDTLSTDIRWDVSDDPRGFYGRWQGKRREDRWTSTIVRVIVQGEQSSKDKSGWVRIEIKGIVETSFDFSNFIERAFWFAYNRLFYYKQRRKYVDDAKTDMYDIREEFTSLLGVSMEERLEA